MSDPTEELLNELASLARRPYDFVIWAFPWGEPGSDLEFRKGPEPWQAKVLFELQTEMLAGRADANSALAEAYQLAVRSGHDIGKTAFLSWIFWWAFSTREDTRGRATANTERQLLSILQPELAKWHRLFIAHDLFKMAATTIRSADRAREDTWRFDLIPWSEGNPEAFAGLHNLGKRIIVIFDEASGIHDKIWEVVDGVMHEADTELFWICTGNPTRNHGRFYECWNRFARTWHKYKVDSREVSFTNSEKIAKAIEDWGADSDFVKVRYLGEFPDASTTQLIPVEMIRAARIRPAVSYAHEALILGVDVARFGTNESVAWFRRGKDARSMPILRWRGLSTVELGGKVADLICTHQPDGTFIDEGGVGGGVVDFVRHLGHSVTGVNFGSKPSSSPNGIKVFNKRAEMYVAAREWLREGGCLPDMDEVEDQLVSVEYYFQQGKPEIRLIPKEDMETEGFASPDLADAWVLTFAYPVSQRSWRRAGKGAESEYDPLSAKALEEYAHVA